MRGASNPSRYLSRFYRYKQAGAASASHAHLLFSVHTWSWPRNDSPDSYTLFRFRSCFVPSTTPPGLITKEILSAFRGLVDIEELSLSQSLAPDEIDIVQVNPRRVLSVFKLPNSFVQLITLSLKNVPLKDDDVAYLNDLKELTNLDLSGTGISSEATAHLVALRHSLRCLHLGRNPKIKHQASYNVSL